MDNLEGIERLKELYAALLGGDFSKVEGFLDKEFVVRSPASLPYGGEKRGASGLAAMFSGFIEHWANPRFDLKDYTSNGDMIVAHIDLSVTSRKTGVVVETPVIETWRLHDGKFVEMRAFYADAAQAAAALA